MSEDEYDPSEMLRDIERIFTSYEERNQCDFEDRDEGCPAISGTYVLNRVLEDKVYRREFRLGVVLTDLIPHIYMLGEIEEIKKSGFNHFYEGGRCCLGTDVAVLISWGMEYDIITFFENVVDPFLINTISYREEGVAVMGELGHGSRGMEEYYCSLFAVPETEIKQTVRRVYSILFTRLLPEEQICICRKNKFSDCNCSGKDFLKRAVKDQTLTKGFYNDMRSIPWAKGIKYRKR